MGKASSSKKVARAAKAAGRPGAKKSYAWPAAISAVVIVGIVLVVLSFGGASNASPKVGEHWHAAYGVYDCDAFKTAFPDNGEDPKGIHTHGEGLMHMHPFTSQATGEKANIAAFAETMQFDVEDTSFTAEAINMDRTNGDKCGDEAGILQLVTWDSQSDDTPTVVTKDIADYNPPDLSVWVLAFAPKGAEIPLPPSVENLQDPRALEEGREPPTATTVAPVDGATTTVPADGATTTVPADAPTTTIPPTDETTTTQAP